MNKLLLMGGALLSTFFLNAQSVSNQVIASDGGHSQSGQGSISWTIGEPVIETYNAGSNMTTMGFHQPELLNIPSMIQEQGADKSILVYPNPVKDEISVDFAGFKPGKYNFQLVDALGKLIYTTDENVNEKTGRLNIKLGEVAAGAYFLRVSGNDLNKSVKINKVNN